MRNRSHSAIERRQVVMNPAVEFEAAVRLDPGLHEAWLHLGRLRMDSSPFGSLLAFTTDPVNGYRLDFRSGLQGRIDDVAAETVRETFLEALAAETGGRVLDAERSSRLRDTFVNVLEEFRSRYLITYRPTGVEAPGWHPIDVKLKSARGKVTARRGYLR